MEKIKEYLNKYLVKHEEMIVLDIGSSHIKLLEANTTNEVPQLLNLSTAPISEKSFANNLIVDKTAVSQRISQLVKAVGAEEKRVVTNVPATGIFTKKIKTAIQSTAELDAAVEFEVGSFVPFKKDEVKVDYHVLRKVGNQLEVMVVVVKEEVVNNILEVFSMADLSVAVLDVDFFALQNCFEYGYAENISEPVGLVNMGSRYTTVNLCKSGMPYLVGDLPIGGKVFTEVIADKLNIAFQEAENIKIHPDKFEKQALEAHDALKVKIDSVAVEFNRQLSLFWNASGLEEGIKKIYLSGGGSLLPGLSDAISEKTGVNCEILDPLKAFDLGGKFNATELAELAPFMSVCAGMCLRQPGDKEKYEKRIPKED